MALKTFTTLIACIFFAGSSAYAQAQYRIKVTNLDNKTGKLYIGWYKDAESFMKPRKTALVKIVEVKDQNEVTVGFDEVPSGTYAISTFLDENGNEDLDLSVIGKPREKYGFSNNVKPAMRPAEFKEAAFTVNGENKTLTIHLK
ncbi:DUF2141 domain-containing protein [Chitinophaga sp. GCM10012297]|uniref:DUF2141 domain-containing protein n=1 Tax=Chitinophaga chungangae TaxID=2821488 RepID=A0ABS3YI13_9BACT|nr:DUF2141 domain-containing protein [Chitinophaga chungangae]MBO9154312.1 DUF2141 domain-containing protein [Chitinophaga chungangae]